MTSGSGDRPLSPRHPGRGPDGNGNDRQRAVKGPAEGREPGKAPQGRSFPGGPSTARSPSPRGPDTGFALQPSGLEGMPAAPARYTRRPSTPGTAEPTPPPPLSHRPPTYRPIPPPLAPSNRGPDHPVERTRTAPGTGRRRRGRSGGAPCRRPRPARARGTRNTSAPARVAATAFSRDTAHLAHPALGAMVPVAATARPPSVVGCVDHVGDGQRVGEAGRGPADVGPVAELDLERQDRVEVPGFDQHAQAGPARDLREVGAADPEVDGGPARSTVSVKRVPAGRAAIRSGSSDGVVIAWPSTATIVSPVSSTSAAGAESTTPNTRPLCRSPTPPAPTARAAATAARRRLSANTPPAGFS